MKAAAASRRFLILAYLCWFGAAGPAIAASPLGQLLGIDPQERGVAVEKLAQAGTPVVDGANVLFLARQQGSQIPRLLGDFNWFGRYPDASGLAGGEMTPLPGTQWFFLEARFESNARIEYVFGTDRETTWLDPNNKKTNRTFGSENSVLEMAGYRPSPWLPAPGYQLEGTLHEHQFESNGQSREVTVYVPPGVQEREALPSVYFHDGGLYVDQVPTPQMIEALIAAGKLEPLIAVFVSPLNRSAEYRGDRAFLEFFNSELVAAIQNRYPVVDSPRRRAIVGSSRGGMGALAVAWYKAQPVFGLCGIIQPAFTPATRLLDDVFAADRRELKFTVVAGRHDVRFIGDYYRLLDTLLAKAYPVRHWLSPIGHSHNSWQHDIPNMLMTFFPAR